MDSVHVQLNTASRRKLFPAFRAVEKQFLLRVIFPSVRAAFLFGVKLFVALATHKDALHMYTCRVVFQGKTRAEFFSTRHAPQLLIGVGVLASASDVRAETDLSVEANAAVGALEAHSRGAVYVEVLA